MEMHKALAVRRQGAGAAPTSRDRGRYRGELRGKRPRPQPRPPLRASIRMVQNGENSDPLGIRDEGDVPMGQPVRRFCFVLFTTLAIIGSVGQIPAAAQERFEVTSIKAVRPTLTDTISALQQRDIARAK